MDGSADRTKSKAPGPGVPPKRTGPDRTEASDPPPRESPPLPVLRSTSVCEARSFAASSRRSKADSPHRRASPPVVGRAPPCAAFACFAPAGTLGHPRGPSRRVNCVIASALRIVFTESHRPPRDRVGRRRVSGCSVRDRPHVPVPRRRMSLCNVAAARCLCLRTVIIVGSDAVGSRLRLRHCQVPLLLDRRQR